MHQQSRNDAQKLVRNEGCLASPTVHLPRMGQERPFVHNAACSQFWEGLFAILSECSQFCLRSSYYKLWWKYITSSCVGKEG